MNMEWSFARALGRATRPKNQSPKKKSNETLFAPPTGAAAKPVGTLAVYTACGKAVKRRGYLGSKPSGPQSNLEVRVASGVDT